MKMRRHERHRFTRPHVCNDNSFHDSLMTLCLYVNKPCTLSVSRPCFLSLALQLLLLLLVFPGLVLAPFGGCGSKCCSGIFRPVREGAWRTAVPLYRCLASWLVCVCVPQTRRLLATEMV